MARPLPGILAGGMLLGRPVRNGLELSRGNLVLALVSGHLIELPEHLLGQRMLTGFLHPQLLEELGAPAFPWFIRLFFKAVLKFLDGIPNPFP